MMSIKEWLDKHIEARKALLDITEYNEDIYNLIDLSMRLGDTNYTIAIHVNNADLIARALGLEVKVVDWHNIYAHAHVLEYNGAALFSLHDPVEEDDE